MKKLKTKLQGCIIALLLVLGADYLYMSVWKMLALPVDWWTSWLLAILSALSAWGVIVWVGRD